jgi:hypothetical protein
VLHLTLISRFRAHMENAIEFVNTQKFDPFKVQIACLMLM